MRGIAQVIARNTKNLITTNYDPNDICGLLMYSSAFTWLAATGIIRIDGSDILIENLMVIYKEKYEYILPRLS